MSRRLPSLPPARSRLGLFVAVLLLTNIFAAVTAPRAAESAETKRHPNVVIILTDDQGWGDLSLNGNTNIATPRIDSLARDGAVFDRFYVCPVCAPTRAEFLTGRYHSRGGVHGVSTGAERLNADEHTIAETFRAAGYATGAFGKWHNGTQYPYHPNGRGFDEYLGFTSGHWGQYFDPVLDHNGQRIRREGYIIDILTDAAVKFIEKNQEQPFFCYVPYNTPHSPFQVPDRFYDKFRNHPLEKRHRDPNKEELDKTRAALAMCENIDWNVGRILLTLDRLGLARDTIVVYFTDNGPNSWRFNGGMKGRKGSTDEGGVRVPCLVRWPAGIQAGTRINAIAGAIDLLPTLADLAGIETGNEKPLDGRSLRPLLCGESSKWPDRTIFSHHNGRISARTQQYRLDNNGKLFDMVADPGQRTDVSAEHPELIRELQTAVKTFRDEVVAQAKNDDRPFPIGHPEYPVTELPARDGVPHGKVKRSARAPNCSYFTNWTSREDRISWDVEAATSGEYDVEIFYACPEQDLGATFALTFGEKSIEGRVDTANDPPAIGAAFDRADRGSESYVKDFKPMKLGTISLEKGRHPLTLQALDIPGRQVMEVRLVRMTLKK